VEPSLSEKNGATTSERPIVRKDKRKLPMRGLSALEARAETLEEVADTEVVGVIEGEADSGEEVEMRSEEVTEAVVTEEEACLEKETRRDGDNYIYQRNIRIN
jgi:hypothetical protein